MFRSDFRGLSRSFKYILLHSSYTSLNMRIVTSTICRGCLVDVMWFSCGFSGGFPRFSGGFLWAKGSVHDTLTQQDSLVIPSLVMPTLLERLSDSYAKSGETSYTNSEGEACQVWEVWEVDHALMGKKASLTRRSDSISWNSLYCHQGQSSIQRIGWEPKTHLGNTCNHPERPYFCQMRD